MNLESNSRGAARGARSALMFLAMGLLLNGCASQSEAERLISIPRPVFRVAPSGGHVPPPEDVVADRDEFVAVLDSLHSHYATSQRKTTRNARLVTIGALVVAAAGAASPVLANREHVELKISQAASAVTGILAGITTELQLTRKAEAERLCTSTLYHAIADVRLRYSSLTLPVTDTAWVSYVAFKDSVDRAVRGSCP